MAHVSQCSVHALVIRTTFLGIVVAQVVALLSGLRPSSGSVLPAIRFRYRSTNRHNHPCVQARQLRQQPIEYFIALPNRTGHRLPFPALSSSRRDRHHPVAGPSLLGRTPLQVLCRVVRLHLPFFFFSRLRAVEACSNTDMPLQLRIIRGWARRDRILISWARARLARSSILYVRHDPSRACKTRPGSPFGVTRKADKRHYSPA